MTPFTSLRSRAVPFPLVNVDTDVIIPKQYLVSPTRVGLGKYAFAPLRYLTDGSLDPAFVFNDPHYAAAQVVVAGRNFGCGSAREHAVWAIQDLGIRSIIAPSFGGSFRSNCFKNGVLPVELPEPIVDDLMRALSVDPSTMVLVDLAHQTVRWSDNACRFEISALRKERLIHGLDDIEQTLMLRPDIERFQREQRDRHAWIWRAADALSGQRTK
jgi:3-isopropylmalate/(R)-2-methylmalate dehydratase small subunit